MKKLSIILLSTFYFLTSHAIAASRLYFGEAGHMGVGDTFPVKALLDSDEAVNAYSISLKYPSDLLELTGFHDGRSIIQVWKSKPELLPGEVKFSGGSFDVFRGQRGELITLNFKALQEGTTKIIFENSTVYLADGKGTAVSPQLVEAHITITGQSAIVSGISYASDVALPEIKFFSLAPDPFNQKQKFLTFFVTDVDSGIKSTEIRTMSYVWWSNWSAMGNPAPIPGSVWAVELRAIDNNNNVVNKTIYAWVIIWRFIIITGTAGIGAIFAAWYILRKRDSTKML